MIILIKALQLILSLSILVMVHEFGHFLFARLFKTRVEKFRLFFDPWFPLWKKQIGETEYGIGWLPLGGYVKISGMIDESMDKEAMKLPPQPYEFRSKPAWQRLLIMVGGVLFNVILAFLIYAAVLWTWGNQYLPVEEARYGVVASSVAEEIGFKDGDKILRVNGETIERFSKIVPEIILQQASHVEVERNGEIVKVDIGIEDFQALIGERKTSLFGVRVPFEVADFVEGSGAAEAGIEIKDRLVGFNGQRMEYFDQYLDSTAAYKGQEVLITVNRGGQELDYSVQLDENGKLGIYAQHPSTFFNFKTERYGFFEAIPAGVNKGIETISDYLRQFKLIFSPETKAYESLGGFISIGSIFPEVWDWQSFWNLTAFLSIILAVMNILPIPALDGGHVMILFGEILTGRKPSEKFLEYAQIAGMIILVALLLFANINDVVRLFK